jgi:hypothetical protein
MPVVEIPAVSQIYYPRPAKPRAVLRMADPSNLGAGPFRIEVALNFAPVTVRHSQLAAAFANIERPGRQPLATWANPQLEQVTFQAVIVNDFSPGYAHCEDKLQLLRLMALLPTDVIFAYGRSSNNKRWKLTEFSYETNTRDPDTDQVLRATGDFTLTESIPVGTQIVPGIQRLATVPTGRLGANGNGAANTPSQRNAAVNDPYDPDAVARARNEQVSQPGNNPIRYP